jgi:hypothetical protein
LKLARLSLLLFAIGLTASRAGVVLHELAGHFAVADATSDAGCRLTELRLFWFGGGWVSFECGARTLAQQLASDLGGIGAQLAAGAVLLAVARWRRRGLLGLFAACFGLLFVLHGLFYLATGIHYGVGDGRTLHVLLASARAGWVAAASAALVALSFAFASDLGRRLAPLVAVSGGPWRGLGTVSAAIVLATALHGALMRAEQAWLADADYAATFRPQPQLEAEAALRRFEAERPRATPEEVAAKRRAVEAEHRIFPLRPVLGAGMAAAALAGLARALRKDGGEPGALGARSALLRAGLACGVSIAIAAALDRWL